jgi:hypothetical protein
MMRPAKRGGKPTSGPLLRLVSIKSVGLTRAAGVVCPGDGALMATSVLAATTVD